MKVADAMRLHEMAVEELAATAAGIPAEEWNHPLAEGKWSPSQVIQHLILAYDAMIRELETGVGLRIRTKWWQRLLLRVRVRPAILAGRGFPEGVRAPRELAPATDPTVQAESLETLRLRARELTTQLDNALATRRVRLSHPYLGGMRADEALRFCAAHVTHHRRQFPGG